MPSPNQGEESMAILACIFPKSTPPKSVLYPNASLLGRTPHVGIPLAPMMSGTRPRQPSSDTSTHPACMRIRMTAITAGQLTRTVLSSISSGIQNTRYSACTLSLVKCRLSCPRLRCSSVPHRSFKYAEDVPLLSLPLS